MANVRIPKRSFSSLAAIGGELIKGFNLYFNAISFNLPIFAVICLALTWPVAAQEYSGTGSINYRVYSVHGPGSGKVAYEAIFRYRFSVSNELWQIRVEKFPVEEKETVSYVECTYDGLSTYVIIAMKQAMLEQLTSYDKLKNTNVVGEAFPISFAPPYMLPINPVWFAFCSGHYLRKSDKKLLCPLRQESKRSIIAFNRLVPANFDVLDAELFLPKACEEFSDGFRYDVVVTNVIVAALSPVARYPGAFGGGFREIIYRADATTNVGGYLLPSQFNLKQFMPDLDGKSSNDVTVTCEYIGSLDSIEFGKSSVDPSGGIKRNAMIDDYRTAGLNPAIEMLQYKSPGESWLPLLSGSLPYDMYERRINGTRVPLPVQTRSAQTRSLLIRYLIGFMVLPVGVFLVKKLLKNTTKSV